MPDATKTIRRPRITQRLGQTSLLRGMARAFGYLTRSERRVAVGLFASTFVNAILGLVGLASVLPFFQLLVKPDPLGLDSILGRTFHVLGITSELHAIILAAAVLIGLMVAKNLFGIFHARVIGHFCAAVETRMATETLRRVVQAPFAWYLKQNTSVLRDVVTNYIAEWARGIIRPALNLANNGFMLLSGLGLLVPFTPIPALIVALLIFIVGGALIMLARPKIVLAAEHKRQNSLIAGVAATEAITGGREVRMSWAGSVLLQEFLHNYSIYAHSDADARQWQLVPRYGIEIIGVSAIVVIAIGALLSGVNRFETASILALYAVVAIRLIPIIGDTANAFSIIQISLPRLIHLDALLEELQLVKGLSASEPPLAGWSRLALEKVHYRYEPDAPDALDGVSLVIERGRSYGLVGSSGAGKSTLADVVAGLLMPNGGKVMVDNTPLADESALPRWRHHVSYVSQSPLILDTTLADNIILGSSAKDRDHKLAAAIDAAGLGSVVAALDKKEDTAIGDRGTRLSGGQRQRVAIARAIYQDADVLVLDEATSALDSLTEREVADAVDALKGRVTILVIAHRLSTVVRCDEIILLDHGRIVARGSHSELLASSGPYRRFAEAQSIQLHPA